MQQTLFARRHGEEGLIHPPQAWCHPDIVLSLTEIVEELQDKHMMPFSRLEALDNLSNAVSVQPIKRAVQNASKSATTRETFPPELRAFALTLQFYSTKAYEYVRETFCLALPHVRTLQDWYTSINGNPGFTQEAFDMLREKVSVLPVSIAQVVQHFIKHLNAFFR